MNLGRHCPISTVLRDGIMRIGQKSQRERLSEETVDEWFSQGKNTDNLSTLYYIVYSYKTIDSGQS